MRYCSGLAEQFVVTLKTGQSFVITGDKVHAQRSAPTFLENPSKIRG